MISKEWTTDTVYTSLTSEQVQLPKKMHDLYATNHFSQMVLPDAFWAVYR